MQLRWETMLLQWESAMSRILEMSADKLPEATATQQTQTTESTPTAPATTKPPPYETPYCNLQMELDRYCSRMSRFGEGEFNCPRAEGFEGQMVARFGLNKSGKQVLLISSLIFYRIIKPGYRCYGVTAPMNLTKACVDDFGEATGIDCTDPVPISGVYCNRQEEIEDLLEKWKYKRHFQFYLGPDFFVFIIREN